ncbi:TPA: hypothetical protein L9P67_002685 [Klebsiella pneumoniae]|uniref:hypothetical protein n=1 Tax=Klebsiella pneumoniae TaxID=573 RepID=UPI00115B3730|nr:hypothetical protein [Klebsiella pneumoniae]QMC30517.1 hypothetical protein HVZ82_13695 [Klebsiella pneumoniae]HBQ8407040.1 hypothetical protein [Klebsiella pneumoniae]HBR2415358.1 hypothetical protein [Klebsiella pneumoniae]HCA6390363.1 hypothetical protein [Klebsiella pneumoniae]HDI2446452.1 hypothetical protein [Klebsiella pneumoniae]
MKNLHKSWPRQVVRGLKYLAKLDQNSLDHPIYIIRANELYEQVSAQVRSAYRATLGDAGPDDITYDALYYYYTRNQQGDPRLDFFVLSVRGICTDLIIAKRIYDTECLFFALLCVQRRDEDARRIFNKLLRPAVAIYRMNDSMNVIGLRGGRHKNPLYMESHLLANLYRRRHPDARDTETASYVHSCFSVNESNIPSKETIRRWLREF